MRTLPKPLPDELLYSALARATYRYGFWSPKRYLDALYGRRNVLAVPDLPGNLEALSQVTEGAWGLTARELAQAHTLIQYYAHFRTEGERKRLIDAMRGEVTNLHVRLGVCAGSARAPTRFRLCLHCHTADMKQFGEAYWHRAHHLPGVLVCHVHGAVLMETQIPFRPAGRYEYASAPLELGQAGLKPIASRIAKADVAQAIAVRSFELLNSGPHSARAKPDYRTELERYGFHSGKVGAEKLRGSFVSHFGEDLITNSFRGGEPLAWLAETLRAQRRPMHPFKHILMSVFLRDQQSERTVGAVVPASGKVWGIFRDENLRREAASLAGLGLKTHAVARALDVDWKTANRLLEPIPCASVALPRVGRLDRQAWQELACAYPELGKKELRARAPALYTRLYRHDREWLLAWKAERQPKPALVRRVDWSQRDLETECRVRECAARVRAEVPPRRVSRSLVLGLLGLRALFAHRASLLPAACAALEEVCESVDAFQVRRVAQALARNPERPLPKWCLLRKAGIQPSRVPDGGRDLLARAAIYLRHAGASESQRGAGS